MSRRETHQNYLGEPTPYGDTNDVARSSYFGIIVLAGFKKDRFYVTAFQSHEVYEVRMNGAVRRILGNGQRGIVNGSGDSVRLSYPNGIACDPWAPYLYINEFDSELIEGGPRRAIVRQIDLQE